MDNSRRFLLPKSLLSSLNLAKVALTLLSVSGWLVWFKPTVRMRGIEG